MGTITVRFNDEEEQTIREIAGEKKAAEIWNTANRKTL